MNGRVVPIGQLSDRDVRAWRDLAKHAIEPNPVFEADCIIPAARYLPNGAEMSLVIAEDEGRFFGCFPVIRVAADVAPSATWPGIGRPAFTTQVRRMRWDLTPLMSEERGIEAATALLSALTHRGGAKGAGILVLEALDADGPVSSYIACAARKLRLPVQTYRTWERPVVRRRDELTYRSIHGAKSLRKIARSRRLLGEKLDGEVQLVDRSADALAVDALIAIEAAGYKGKTTGRRQGLLRAAPGATGGALMSHPGEPEWFREMCDGFRSAGRLLLYSLQVGDSVVAMQLMLRGGEGLFGLMMVFQEDYAHWSPGVHLALDSIDRFHEATDAQWSDTCTYEGNETLLRLYPDRRKVSTVLVAVGGPLDRWHFRLYMAYRYFFAGGSRFRRLYLRRRLARLCDAIRKALGVPRPVPKVAKNPSSPEL